MLSGAMEAEAVPSSQEQSAACQRDCQGRLRGQSSVEKPHLHALTSLRMQVGRFNREAGRSYVVILPRHGAAMESGFFNHSNLLKLSAETV
jgi:hypothetical protein